MRDPAHGGRDHEQLRRLFAPLRSVAGDDVPCLPVLSYRGSGRRQLKSRLRSAMSPWLDRRQEIDIIRDRLEERALALGGLDAVS